ncbi:amino acid ABC transporter ATP-binding protein [Alcaligenes faecalis]|uniref:amino acid ABC transporter ATP-binding protein n=1 Tax=Alcaligenes faecalis TaxID=511 RepID=UPI0029332763|nr:amino acid ABC transporter ATP-binding protein [Alcaligenes faecalis]MDV2117215.1 amino acid ABC transporter ATP-binding protein [Alcaligenes faecalis]
MSEIVRIQGLRKSFGQAEILKGIDLSVNTGEVVVMIGGSGSGKSTCLRCINRLETPTSGTIVVADSDVTCPRTDLNQVRQNIGMVFQGIHLYPHMTALGNVMLALRKVKKVPKVQAEEQARHHLEQVGLAERIEHYPSQLSGGQQQRVGIARALALEPKVMLFDEPTSGLDPELVGEVLNVMKRTRDAGMTMVIVTHEMQFAREVGDRIVFMDQGVILDQGSPDEILCKPRHKRIQDFLSRMN